MMLRALAATAALSACVATPAPSDTAGPPSGSCDAAFSYSAEHYGVALLVVQDGATVCEAYAPGMSADQPHALFSGSKGFSGMMAAAAVADGLINLDEPVAGVLAEWRDDPLRSRITYRHLLSLSSGLATTGPRAAPGFLEAVATPGSAPPGEVFAYGPGVFQVFAESLRRSLEAAGRPEAPTGYLERRILAPLGVKVAAWGGPVAGPDPNLAAGASMSARDWARFGELALRPELAANVKLDAEAYESQFRPQGAYRGYGLSWWLSTPLDESVRNGLDPVARTVDLPQGANAGRLPADCVAAAGAGGQRLYVCRSLDLVAVRFADDPTLAGRFAASQDPQTRGSAAVGSSRFSDSQMLEKLIAGLPARP